MAAGQAGNRKRLPRVALRSKSVPLGQAAETAFTRFLKQPWALCSRTSAPFRLRGQSASGRTLPSLRTSGVNACEPNSKVQLAFMSLLLLHSHPLR